MCFYFLANLLSLSFRVWHSPRMAQNHLPFLWDRSLRILVINVQPFSHRGLPPCWNMQSWSTWEIAFWQCQFKDVLGLLLTLGIISWEAETPKKHWSMPLLEMVGLRLILSEWHLLCFKYKKSPLMFLIVEFFLNRMHCKCHLLWWWGSCRM